MKDIRFEDLLALNTINRLAAENTDGFIEYCEERFSQNLINIAERISKEKGRTIVALSGPSGSGKTTSAHFLMQYLDKIGIDAVTVSFDNFYKGKDDAPVLPDGRRDYESIYALNIPVMHQCLCDVVKTGRCLMPEFDFNLGISKPDALRLDLEDDGIIILEGIHALNPLIIDAISDITDQKIYKLYISVQSGINEGGKEILSPRDIRLVRRMMRDYTHRNSTPQHTLHLWTNVVDGENKYLIPYESTADIFINSIHPYEPCIFKEHIIMLLKTVKPEDENYEVAEKILQNMYQFTGIEQSKLPENSLLREFLDIK